MNDASLESLTESALIKPSLLPSEAAEAARLLARAEVSKESKAGFLKTLEARGESPDEVAAFAGVFRDLARNPGLEAHAGEAIDIVGTGGDQSGSFNLSTASALLLAAGGVKVLKHGNRSVTSRSGSADLIEALGFDLQADNERLERDLGKLRFCFLFAPAFHPAFKEIMPVRKMLAAEGRKTIFNLLGPLINPAEPKHLLMGVYGRRWIKPISEALDRLELKAGMVSHTTLDPQGGLDELSTVGVNTVAGFGRLRSSQETFSAEEVGLVPGELDGILGGEVERNIELLFALADNRAPTALTESVALNAGAGLFIMGRAESIRVGVGLALDWLRQGKLREWLDLAQQHLEDEGRAS